MASPGPTKNLCGYSTPRGKYPSCQNIAGKGTSHVGYGLCSKHGGTSPTNIKHAETLAVTAACHKLGAPVSTNPFDSIKQLEAEAMGYVEYFRRQVQALDPDMVWVRPSSILRRPLNIGKDGEDPGVQVEEMTSAPVELNVAIKAHRQAMEDLRKISKTAIDAGVAVTLVQLQEKRERTEAFAIHGLLKALGHNPADGKVLALIEEYFPDDIEASGIRPGTRGPNEPLVL